MKLLRQKPGAMPVSQLADEAVHLVIQDAPDRPKDEYVLARKGALILGVGDEDLALKPGEAPEKQNDVRLSKDEKVTRLRGWLLARQLPASRPTPGSTRHERLPPRAREPFTRSPALWRKRPALEAVIGQPPLAAHERALRDEPRGHRNRGTRWPWAAIRRPRGGSAPRGSS